MGTAQLPETLKACIPGCQSIEKLSEHPIHRQGRRQGRPGEGDVLLPGHPLRSRSAVRLHDHRRGDRRGRGFAKGSATVTLDEEGGETVLRYGAQGQVGGKLAQIGSRLIDATSRKMAGEFFDRFAAAVNPESGAASTAHRRRPEPRSYRALDRARAAHETRAARGRSARAGISRTREGLRCRKR